jgi:hypothetical protein
MRNSLLFIALVLLPTLAFAPPKEFQSTLDYQQGVDNAAKINTALWKVPQLKQLGSEGINQQTVKLCNLLKKMDLPGFLSADANVNGLVTLIESGMSPSRINNIYEAYQSMIVKANGMNPDTEVVIDTTKKLGDAIRNGGIEGAETLIQLQALTKEESKEFITLKDANERYKIVSAEMIKHFVNFDQK